MLHVASNHRGIEVVRRGKAHCRATALVVVHLGDTAGSLERRLPRAMVERLDPVLWSTDRTIALGGVEADHVVQLRGERRVVR
jgi:hypothetical protein